MSPKPLICGDFFCQGRPFLEQDAAATIGAAHEFLFQRFHFVVALHAYVHGATCNIRLSDYLIHDYFLY